MRDFWESWVGGLGPEEFLDEVDVAVAEGLYRDRRAAFLAYAHRALAELAYPHWGPPDSAPGISPEKLADLLLACASLAGGREYVAAS